MDPIILPISAGFSGIIEAGSTHWLDRIKTKMQELTLDKKSGNIMNATKSIYLESGLSGFYLGIVPRIIGIVPMRVIYWSTMVKMNSMVVNSSHIVQYILPGLVAGSVQTILDNPIEAIKIQLMTRGKNKKEQLNITTFSDVKKLYIGFMPCLIRNTIFAVVVASSVKKFGQKQENKFLAGAIGGFVGSVLSQPFDVIKTELQRCKTNNTKIKINTNTFKMLYDIAKNNPRELWSGGSMRCTLAFLNMGIGFHTLGHIHKSFENLFI